MLSNYSEMKQKNKCGLCPRNCNVDRKNGEKGFCGENEIVRVARASLHMWEEPCISGKSGSGTVFFSGCPLKCVFCQNRSIALGNKGTALTIRQLADIFLLLQEKGANNINLVTPTHFVPQISEALCLSKEKGLIIPVVYNTGSYESIETIKSLDGLIDIYLPDLKYKSPKISKSYSNAADYFEYAAMAIEEMVRQTGRFVFENGLMKRGTIVRHMIMPGCTRDSKEIIKYLYDKYGDDIYISIMNQYTPPKELYKYPELSRKITRREYDKVVNFAIETGIKNAFIQEEETAKESFIPDFDEDVFLKEVL